MTSSDGSELSAQADSQLVASAINLNEIIANVVTSTIELSIEKLRSLGTSGLEAIRVHLKTAYSVYLKKIAKEHSTARSFFSKDECDLYSFYVPVGVGSARRRLPKATSKGIEEFSRTAVICGQAGCGKSILLRHLLLDSLATSHRIPVFCELKELNNKTRTIDEIIRSTLHDRGFRVSQTAFDAALEKGHFLFLFDGYDELDPQMRFSIGEQIKHVGVRYSNCSIILTSRPDPEFSGWHGFTRLDVMPLSLQQSCELVEKLPIDASGKEKFLEDLRDHLYKKHISFLSNPMLLTIMLLTYEENAEIPNKLNVFFGQAFEALYQRHDARKGAFQRKKKSGLDVQDFARVFAAFCLVTYDKRLLRFSAFDALSFLKQARAIVEINFVPQDYLSDLMQAVPLIIEDGLFLTFAHRSFQEYFVARFIHESAGGRKEALVSRYRDLIRRDNTIALLYEMDPHVVEKIVILPVMAKLLDALGRTKRPSVTLFLKYLSLMYVGLGVPDDRVVGFLRSEPDSSDYFDVTALLMRRLGHIHGFHRGFNGGIAIQNMIRNHPDFEAPGMVRMAKIRAGSALGKALYEYDGFHGGRSFKKLLEIVTAIELRHRNRTESLDALLTSPRTVPVESVG